MSSKPSSEKTQSGCIAAIVLACLVGCTFFVSCWCFRDEDGTIPFEVLRKTNRKLDGKIVMEILVSESASKDEVLKLAESLRRKHLGNFAVIDIFDSREAWKRTLDNSYQEKQYRRHFLARVAGTPDFALKDGLPIHWFAEGRDH